jgi:PAS domain S-box-containing protein
MSQKPSTVALRVSLLYAVTSWLWIFFSDRLLGELVRDREWLLRLATAKGWFFVTFTAVLFFFTLRRLLARDREKIQELKAAAAVKASTEQALRVSEASYRNFFNTIGDAIYVLDEAGKFLAVNDGAVAMYGYAKEDFIGQTPEFLFAPGHHDTDLVGTAIQRAFGGEPQQFERLGRRKSGEVFPKEIRLEKGIYFGRAVVFATGRDITKRRQAEAELRNERRLLRTLVDLAPDFIFVKDTESRYLLVNASLAAGYGQKPGRMLGRTDADFMPAEQAAQFRASEIQVMAAVPFHRLEGTISFPDGQTRTVVTNMVAFRDGQGEVCGLVGIGRDVSGQKVIEKSMRLQSVALEAAANAILITDHNGQIEWVNPAFTRSTGYTLAESLGKNPRELLRSGRHERQFYQQMWNTILAGQVWQGEVINRCKDGSLVQEEMTITPVLDRENRTTHFIAIRQDITERKQLEEHLRAASERTKFYMNRMPLGFIAWDREFRAAEWNAAAEAIFGWPAGEALGRHAYELIVPPEAQPQADKIWEQIITTGDTASHFINENITRDGRRLTCEWRNTPWRDAGGQICGFLSIVSDITEQKLAEEKFAREQARFKLIFDTMPVGIAFHTIHPDGSITRLVNDAHLRICGLTREQSTDLQNYIKITHPEDRAVQLKLMAEHVASQVNQFSVERRLVHPDKSVVWVNLSFQRETHPDGTVEELTTLVDITERKAVEQQLLQLAVIVESSEDAIISKTLTGIITSWNRGAEMIFGYPAGETIGNSMLMLFPDELKHEETDILARIARGEGIEHFETERVRQDRTRIRISATISPLKDSAGNVVGASTIARDTTHQHILEEQLRQSQKMEAIGQLAGGVAHDFNNILAVIQMQTELSKIAGNFSAEQTACIDEIQVAANRAANLTRQLLLFSRRQRLQPRELDLSDSITGMTKMLRRILGEDIQMHFKYAPQPLFIQADAGMMDQVLMNLTLNSRDAMPEGGQLVIETAAVDFDAPAAELVPNARPGAFVRLSVGDTGCGIPPEIMPRIFEPFFTTKDVGKGTGLGLATVFSIVQQHQGWIGVNSAIARGTTFHIYLPRLNKSSGQPATSSVLAAVSGGKETILVVEDDDALRASVQKSLAQLGYHLLEAASGAAALAVWQKQRDKIDLLLTDLVMPGGMSGKTLGEQLLQENPQLKVIYTSGYSAEVFGKDFPLAEGVNFLAKPFPMQTLAQTVRACLDE